MSLKAKAQAAHSHFIKKMYRLCPDVLTGLCGLNFVRHNNIGEKIDNMLSKICSRPIQAQRI
jgi:hypothetical protein